MKSHNSRGARDASALGAPGRHASSSKSRRHHRRQRPRIKAPLRLSRRILEGAARAGDRDARVAGALPSSRRMRRKTSRNSAADAHPPIRETRPNVAAAPLPGALLFTAPIPGPPSGVLERRQESKGPRTSQERGWTAPVARRRRSAENSCRALSESGPTVSVFQIDCA